ncbi:DUF5412 domain-containing protein [Priestia endophytica]|uniref:DUF5412 domain-containing protein n=1 Tax=Priestia endophytica TaxID=135735 RepID=UPI000F526A9E|nr:DUF5412 domain-containing protein [Priestia endophytica]RPJ98358.1 hypothetical protein FH5_03660 [Priestia endophytica]
MNTDLINSKRKGCKKKLKVFFFGLLLFVGLIGYGIYWAFFDMDRLPTGDYLTEEKSPDGVYTLKAYVTNGGATTSFAVRGELVFNNKSKKTKNIYWNYREESADIKWIDNNTVAINGHILNVPNDKFDFRNQ